MTSMLKWGTDGEKINLFRLYEIFFECFCKKKMIQPRNNEQGKIEENINVLCLGEKYKYKYVLKKTKSPIH